jgi:hypothetical protein
LKQASLLKKYICEELIQRVSIKLININFLISSAVDSRNNDTKSSAGDKHETSRAKVQTDIDNYTKQKLNLTSQLNLLKSIDLVKTSRRVDYGSMVYTNKGIFFIAIGLGKLTLNEENIFAISLASPIGMVMKHKLEFQTFNFRNIVYKITKIL